ncbi:LLM class flavin-dependent oxidoreductase [Streptomyces flaveolus]|uniref:LLM class flavin-dependent oxidoreductase n=1 Tax=Streptomyces flaveolus TaxID=67297 RepID=UPI00341CC18C
MPQSAAATSALPPLSVLELALAEEGRSAHEALAAVVSSAQQARRLGFRRVWVAEHHRYRSVASVAPPVMSAHLAAKTSGIRIGSGGMLLGNHAPLVIAEQFSTLAALHPDRIDLGIGRGPGTSDVDTVRALRRGADQATHEEYRAGLLDLLEYLAHANEARVLTGADTAPQPWLLSSSVAGAELAAELGLPLAFAHHVQPGNTLEALGRYRERFLPSRWCQTARVLVSVETLCAPTEAEAAYLARPAQLVLAAVLTGQGVDAVLVPPAKAAAHSLDPEVEDRLARLRATQAHGTPETVRRRLATIAAQTAADELMLSTPVYDAEARTRSLILVADASMT